MKIRAFKWAVAVAVWACAVSSVSADDVAPPTWRGDPGSTFQEWEFLTSANPATPESVSNPYGSPSASISLGWANSDYWPEYPPLGGTGRMGVWDLGRGIDPGHPADIGRITLTIPNRDFTPPGSYKDIVVQVTYHKDITDVPTVDVPGATPTGSSTQLVETVPDFGAWWVIITTWHIEPNPLEEVITITGNWNGSVIDQIVVDTLCIPEPASLGLLLVGGVSMLARRRRKGA